MVSRIFTKSYIWPALCATLLILVATLSIVEFNYNYFNNYLIFTRPLRILLQGGNIYDFHPEYYMDTFKYSPSFAILVGVLSYLPNPIGIVIWNVLNALVLVLGIRAFFSATNQRIGALLLLFPMLAISVHNHQSNPLMAGLMLLFISALRSKKPLQAAIFITLCLFIKFYAVLLSVAFLFFEKKKEFIRYTGICILVMALLPLLLIEPAYLLQLYKNWWHVLQTTTLTIQCSWMGIAQNWLGWILPHWLWAISGLILLLIPLTNTKMYKEPLFQHTFIASIFVFMILFNKMAGFPTYIVAVVGCCIWFFNLDKKNIFSKSIVLSIFVLGICSQYYRPYSLVDRWIISSNIWALPFLILWIYLQVILWRMEFNITYNTDEKKAMD